MKIEVLDNTEIELYRDDELMKFMGMADEPEDENERYFAIDGDFFNENSDKVKHDGIELEWNLVFREGEPVCYVLINFDHWEYPIHAKMCEAFAEQLINNTDNGFQYDRYNSTWKTYNEADNAIAYRGGRGYTYGIYVLPGNEFAIPETYKLNATYNLT